MANAYVLRRREQLITHCSALAAARPLSRILLDGAHDMFPMFKVDLRFMLGEE